MRGQRGAQEDAHAALAVPHSPFLLLLVLDGHGGRATADFAAAQLLPCLLATHEWAAAAASGFEDEAALCTALRAAFASCDDSAYQALGATGDRSGACALAALVSPTRIIVGNCGDCRAVLVRRAGAAALSKDHRPDAPSERARMAPLAGAAATGKRGYFQGLAVSRSRGGTFAPRWTTRAPARPLPCLRCCPLRCRQ